jgi:cytochrome c-type biogenesis protein CcmH
MTLWFVFALMTAAAIFAVLWPLSYRAPRTGGTELAVYRDQLDEISRDRAAGLIGEAEADAARVEISRRLIAASQVDEASRPVPTPVWRRRATALVGLLLLPAGAIALYMAIGSPRLPGEPLAARLEDIHQHNSLAAMIAKIEQHLERNPNDARGWQVIAPVYLRLGQFQQAVTARRKLIALQGDSAEREADLGEALTAEANGVVTADAKAAFDRAAKLDPNEAKSQFFLGMAAEQDGNKEKAASIWRALLANAPPGAQWADMVRQALTRVGAAPPPATAQAPGPDAGQVAAAAQMSEADRNAMIRGMVEQLAGKLKENGDDLNGWQRLLRAYVVLGERDKAHAAAGDAKRALGGDPGKLRQIEDVIKSLGLQS